jgi:hypothetical protein
VRGESERVLVQLVHGILWWSIISPNNLNIVGSVIGSIARSGYVDR